MSDSQTEASARQVFGARAAHYTTSAAHADPRALARLVAMARAQADWVALDVATGTGHTAFALAPHVSTVVGADLTPEMLDEARKLQAQNGLNNVAFQIADAHRLPFGDGAFDLVVSRRAPHHFADIHRALGEMRRVVKPGGRLVIDDRSVPEDDFVDAVMNELDRYHDPSHVRQYRPGEWRRLLAGAGFQVDEMEPYTLHRPLSSLTQGVDEMNVARIHVRLAQLNASQRALFHLTKADGETRINHWYVIVSATAQ